MLPRGFVILLCFLFAGAGGWAGHRYFDQAVDFMNAGSVSLLVRFHGDARELARYSFAIAAGLLALCVPLSALLAARFRSRARYVEPLLAGLLIGLLTTGAALLFYRQEMRSIGIKVGELLSVMRDSKREIVFNPLTRSLLVGAALTMVGGLARAFISPLSGKK
jgi:hypothetical protein